MYYNKGLRLIVLIISCFLAKFTGRPQDDRKGGAYMRKRFETVTEKEKGYEGETNGKVNGGFKNRNVSAANRERVLVGWKKRKRKNH